MKKSEELDKDPITIRFIGDMSWLISWLFSIKSYCEYMVKRIFRFANCRRYTTDTSVSVPMVSFELHTNAVRGKFIALKFTPICNIRFLLTRVCVQYRFTWNPGERVCVPWRKLWQKTGYESLCCKQNRRQHWAAKARVNLFIYFLITRFSGHSRVSLTSYGNSVVCACHYLYVYGCVGAAGVCANIQVI